MNYLTKDKIYQFSSGFKLLLEFDIGLSNSSSLINEIGDTWEVTIVKPDGTVLTKTTDLSFLENAKPIIAVPIEEDDLNRKGVYRYQVSKTTSNIAIKSLVSEFTVQASLPI